MSEPQPIIIERTFHAPVSVVWEALTNKDKMKAWYFDVPEFKPVPGLKFQFYAGDEKKQYLHLCEVTEVIVEKKVQYSWRYDGYRGESRVTFELFEEGEKTKLRLTHEGLETFPDTNPDLAKARFVEGWTYLINTSLVGYLHSLKPIL